MNVVASQRRKLVMLIWSQSCVNFVNRGRNNSENFKALKDDMVNLKAGITEVETRVGEVEDRTRLVEEAMAELAKFYHKLEAKQIDLHG